MGRTQFKRPVAGRTHGNGMKRGKSPRGVSKFRTRNRAGGR